MKGRQPGESGSGSNGRNNGGASKLSAEFSPDKEMSAGILQEGILNREVKERLFGAIGKVPVTNDTALPSDEELGAPFEWERGVVRCFCWGCGSLAEISETLANELFGTIDVPLAGSFFGKYFVVHRCIICDDNYLEPRLASIQAAS